MAESLGYRILTSFHLTPEESSQIEKYYLLHWSGKYFRHLYEQSARFQHQGISYQIIFCDHNVRETLLADKVAVSFRKESPIFPYGYALVRPLTDLKDSKDSK